MGRLYEVERSSDQPFPDFPNRITYLIDPAGVIREAWTVSDIPAHADAVLAAIASAGAAA